jgi:transcriptional regulator with XRE-family HTH domain
MPATGDPFYLEVGRRIQGLRVSKGLTQGQLGQRLNPPVTRASIANLENGRQRLLLHTFVEIAEILDCGLSDLIPAAATFLRDASAQTQVADELERAKVPHEALTRISRQLMMPAKKDKK